MFRSLKVWLVYKLGGYIDIDDYLESIADDPKQKRYILTRAVKLLYNTIGAEDILQEVEKGKWKFRGKTMTDGEKNVLIAEATAFQNSRLWEVLQADVKYQANRKTFLLANDESSITAGKLWHYTFDVINNRLKRMIKQEGSTPNADF